MIVQQVAFNVPEKIALGLATGELKQYGGVVRNATGHIVKHLDPVGVSNSKAIEVAAQAMALAKQNKKVAIAAVAVAGVAFAGGTVYHLVRSKQRKEERDMRQAAFDHFYEELFAYIQLLNEGNLSVEAIERLEDAIESLHRSTGEEGLTVEIDSEQLKELVSSIVDYTKRFAKANNYKTSGNILSFFSREKTDLTGLQECLETQKTILSAA